MTHASGALRATSVSTLDERRLDAFHERCPYAELHCRPYTVVPIPGGPASKDQHILLVNTHAPGWAATAVAYGIGTAMVAESLLREWGWQPASGAWPLMTLDQMLRLVVDRCGQPTRTREDIELLALILDVTATDGLIEAALDSRLAQLVAPHRGGPVMTRHPRPV